MRNRLIVLTFAFCVSVAPLFAGTTQPNASKRQEQAIDELINVMHMDRVAMQTADAMVDQMTKPLIDSGDADAKWAVDRFRELIRQEIDFKGLTRDLMMQVYPKYFTDDDLEQIVAFYRSSTGQKMIDTMPALLRDSMQLSQEELTGKMTAIIKQVSDEQEKRKPWQRTMRDITALATAVEAYAADHDDTYPQTDDFVALAGAIGHYAKDLPSKDVWGNTYAYAASPDGKHYRIISAGSDGNFEWDSRRIAASASGQTRYSDRAEDDLIYADGEWLQLPKASKGPKTN